MAEKLEPLPNGFTSEGELTSVLSSLRGRFRSGITKKIEWRRQQLKQCWWMLEDCAEEIIQALVRDLARTRFEALSADVITLRDDLLETLENLSSWTADESPDPIDIMGRLGSAKIRKEPLGVALIIGAWNFPFLLLLQPLFAAIAAGCCVVLKPSELAPNCSSIICKMVQRYLDPEAIRVVTAGPKEMDFVLKQRYDMIFFTGSSRVAKVIAAAAAKHLTPVVLELGGQGPAIVTKTANIDIAAKRIAAAKFINAGQICLNVNHVFAEPDIIPQLSERLVHYLKEFFPSKDPSTIGYASIINMSNFQRIENLLKRTNGNVVHGGELDRERLRIYPAVVENVRHDDSLLEEELFAPIIPIVSASVEDALEWINSHEHPLAIYIFSQNPKEKQMIIDATLSGGVTINDCMVHASVKNAPFGGVGNAGHGYYHGKWGLLSFSHLRTVFDMPTWSALDNLMAFRYPPHPDSGKAAEIMQKKLKKKVHFRRNESLEAQRKHFGGMWDFISRFVLRLGSSSAVDGMARWIVLLTAVRYWQLGQLN